MGGIYLAPTADGKLAVIRDMQMNTGLSWPTTIPAVAVGVYAPGASTWSYQLISGDLNKSGGPYGYTVQYSVSDRAVLPSTSALNLLVRCSGNCGSIKQKLLAITMTGSGSDYPRSTVVNINPRMSSPYIALGDSFSAGEGNPPFEAGTDIGENKCHRSSAAYPRLIAGTSAKIPSINLGGFRACSGAVALNIGDSAPSSDGIQLDWWPDTAAQVVTVAIGGNDIKFGDFAKACTLDFASCAIGSTPYNTSLNKVNNELTGKLTEVYRKILKYTPNAKVFVIGYPQVMANKAPHDPFDIRCGYMYDLNDATDHWKDVRAARDIVAKLNQKISDTVTVVSNENTGNARLKYVPVDGSTSEFVGHEVCGSSTSWFLNVDQVVNSPDYVFHPNASGQQGYASMVAAEINAN